MGTLHQTKPVKDFAPKTATYCTAAFTHASAPVSTCKLAFKHTFMSPVYTHASAPAPVPTPRGRRVSPRSSWTPSCPRPRTSRWRGSDWPDRQTGQANNRLTASFCLSTYTSPVNQQNYKIVFYHLGIPVTVIICWDSNIRCKVNCFIGFPPGAMLYIMAPPHPSPGRHQL